MLTYNEYQSKETLYHTPDLIGNLEFYYKLKNNIKISSDISYISGLVGSNALDGTSESLSPILDVNLKLDYKFNEKISAFVYANNLLSKKYVYFNYYPVQGINFLGGLTISF